MNPLKSLAKNSDNLKTISQYTNELTEIIKNVLTKSKEIEDVAFQAKLLSFNASVEVARAGEAGKGFAVVAEEVGKLAVDSKNSAEMIADLIAKTSSSREKINQKINEQIEELNNFFLQSQSSLGQSKESLKSIDTISHELNHVSQSLAENLKNLSETSNNGLETLSKNLSDCIGVAMNTVVQDLSVSEVKARLDEFIIIDVRQSIYLSVVQAENLPNQLALRLIINSSIFTIWPVVCWSGMKKAIPLMARKQSNVASYTASS